LNENNTIEGAPFLSEEHLPVFDCAMRPYHGTRSIGPMGHIRMMAVVQPFLSGAISKTVNLEEETTPGEIAEINQQAWKLGLKAVAIYRNGCKRSQPLSAGKAKKAETALSFAPVRRRLPDEREAITHKFDIAGGHEGYITAGMFEDGSLGEIFLVMAKEGSVVSGLMDSFATAISIALQYGVPVEALVKKFTNAKFDPSGFTNNPQIPFAKSIVDYIFRWIGLKFLSPQQLRELGVGMQGAEAGSENQPLKPGKRPTTGLPFAGAKIEDDAPPCHVCGAIMVRSGACYKCMNCGSTSGCS